MRYKYRLSNAKTQAIFICQLLLSSVAISTSNVQADSLEAATHITTAEQLKTQGNSYKALYYYQLALYKDKNNVAALFALAEHDINARHYDMALTRLDKLSNLDAYNEQVFLLKSKVYETLENWQQALHALDVAEQLDSENPEVQLRFENIYRMMGDEDKAQQSKLVHKRLVELEKNKWENPNER